LDHEAGVRPLEKIQAWSHAALRFLWHRGLEIKGIRSILLAIVPRTLGVARRLRGTLHTHAQPSPPEDVLVSPERFVPEFQSDVPYAKAHIERYRFAAEHLLPSDTVLDAACGSGYGTAILSRFCRKTTGIDKSAAAIAYAREKYGRTFHVQDLLRRSPFRGRHDVIVSFETIEHIDAPLPKVLRRLALGARRMVIGSVPYLENKGNAFHRHFHLHEGHLGALERYGSVTYYFQEPEPGYRIYPHPLPKTQNLIFVLVRSKSHQWRWHGRNRAERIALARSEESPSGKQVEPPGDSTEICASSASMGVQTASSHSRARERGHEPSQRPRLLVVANSQGAPSGLNGPDRYLSYPLQLQGLLPTVDCTVWAMSSLTVETVASGFDEVVLQHRPTVVVLQCGVIEGCPRILPKRLRAILECVSAGRGVTRFLHRHRASWIRLLNHVGTRFCDMQISEFERHLREVCDKCHREGIQLVLVGIPMLAREFEQAHVPQANQTLATYDSVLRGVAEELKLRVADSLLGATDPTRDTLYLPGSVHFSVAGHALVAGNIASSVADLMLAAGACSPSWTAGAAGGNQREQ
jgi:SAM-dependent methyltransferase